MAKSYKLRRLDPPASAIVALDASEFPDCTPTRNSIWWAAYDDRGRVAGYCILEPWTGGVAFLARSWVSRPHRGNGLQRRLIRVRESHARRAGFKKLVSYTASYNCPSANSLIRCGYRTYEPQQLWGLDGCTYWFKILEGK